MISFRDNLYRVDYKLLSDGYLKEYLIKNPVLIAKNNSRQSYFQNISNSSEVLPKINWNYSGNKIIQRMSFINGSAPKASTASHKLIKFSQNLDLLGLQNYPHGDICRKNIIEDDRRLYLIDVEPILEYALGGGGIYFASTPSYIHADDINKGRLSIRSDLLGFGCFAMWCLGIYDKPRLSNGDSILKKIKEVSLKDNSFNRLLNYIKNQYPLTRMQKD